MTAAATYLVHMVRAINQEGYSLLTVHRFTWWKFTSVSASVSPTTEIPRHIYTPSVGPSAVFL